MRLDRPMRPPRQRRFNALIDFLRQNRRYPKAHRTYHVRKLCDPGVSARRKLHSVFCAAVSSDRGNDLNQRGEAANAFLEAISVLGEAPQISCEAFLECFRANNIHDVSEWLDELPGIGKKKVALFVRDLFVTQSLADDRRIFSEQTILRADLLIPLDIVIANAWNRIFGRTFTNSQQVQTYFDRFNVFARRNLGNGRMVLEDLWYWGYFCFRNRTKAEADRVANPSLRRIMRFNRAKYLLDPAFKHGNGVPDHFERFIEFVRAG